MGVTLLAPYRHATGTVQFNRLYLPSSGAAAVSPAFDSLWVSTGSADRLKCVTTKISSAMTNKAVTGVSVVNQLARQYVSDPIAAQTISGNIKGQVRAFESLNAANAFSRIVVYVVSNDGSTVRGTLVSVQSGTEFPLSATNRPYPSSTAVTSVVASAGDRIVIEYGAVQSNASSYTVTLSFGDDSASDLPEDATTTAANNPWIEFSQAITLA